MPWYLFTYLHHIIDPPKLTVVSRTNLPGHMFMIWSYQKPRRTPIYTTVRGKMKFCGYRYSWVNPNLEEQVEYDRTFEHTYNLDGLLANRWLYYLLSADDTIYGRFSQTPLVSLYLAKPVEPPYAASVYTHEEHVHQGGYDFPIKYELLAYDYGGLYNPDHPNYLTVQSPGTYLIHFHHTWEAYPSNYRRSRIRLNWTTTLKTVSNWSPDLNPEPIYQGATIEHPLVTGDIIAIETRHPFSWGPTLLQNEPHSPRFHMQKIGP